MSEITLNPQLTNSATRPLFLGKAQAQQTSAALFSNEELVPLVKLLAQRLQISELMAFKLVRKFLGSGHAASFEELQQFLSNFLETDTNKQTQSVVKNFQQATSEAQSERALDQAFKPLIKELGNKYQENKTRNIKQDVSDLFSPRATKVSLNPQIPLPTNLTNPKAFASWLVNNKAAFITLKTNPQLTYLLLALSNPQIQKSPVLMAEITKLLAQLIKLRQGKGLETATEDDVKENLDYQIKQETNVHEHSIVGSVRETLENITINPMRDFLIEAERFAEEEIANLWSLTLKKEKELEEQIRKGIRGLRDKDN